MSVTMCGWLVQLALRHVTLTVETLCPVLRRNGIAKKSGVVLLAGCWDECAQLRERREGGDSCGERGVTNLPAGDEHGAIPAVREFD